MLNVFNTSNPNRIAVRASAFIRQHDPIRRWCFEHKVSDTAPYWWLLIHDDLLTAIPREIYEEGVIATIRDLGTYNVVIGHILFTLAGEFHDIYKGYQSSYSWREEQREREAARMAEIEANPRPEREVDPNIQAAIELMVDVSADARKLLSPEKFYTLDLLMWKLWRTVPEENRIQVFADMFESAWAFLPAAARSEVDTYGVISYHVTGDTESLNSVLYDIWPDEPQAIENAREILAIWRKGGADWLADIYEPQVNERAAKLADAGGDNVDKAA